MKTIENPIQESWEDLLKRPLRDMEDISETVGQIFKEVKQKGDVAVQKYTNLFDGVSLESQFVSPSEIEAAVKATSPELKKAIQLAKANIETFHLAQRTIQNPVETLSGVTCWQERRPIDKVGLYIPGGSAPLFSSVLMLAVPAQIAGCKDIVLCSPPNTNGTLSNEMLYTAQLCGIKTIIKVGGIQAIASITFGTESIPAVYKIFGPGNQFVTAAKQLATQYGVAIDMPAGPSELLVMADETANSAYVASDLLSQAEHGPDSQVVLVSTSTSLLQDVKSEIKDQLETLPRKAIAQKALQNSKFIYMNDEMEALALINSYAPEHLIICTKNDEFYCKGINNAGSVFIGKYSPESAGDYASGTNHTLPTNGYSKAYSGVTLDSFMKSISFQNISKEGLLNIGEAIELMAEAEGLQAHKNAVSLRLKDLRS